MVKTINRYLYKEITHTLILITAILTAITIIGRMLKLVDIILKMGC